MTRIYTTTLGLILLILGLAGFYYNEIFYIIHLDLWLSFVYLISGAIGLKLGLDKNTLPASRLKYIKTTTCVAFILVLFGFSFPNFYDIFHLEMTENVYHLIIALIGSAIIHKSKQV